jgi:hypothetical protein
MPTNNESILSPNHLANNRRYSSGRGTYTYQPAVPSFDFSLGWELEANHSASRVPAGVDTISDGSVNGDGTEYVVLPAVTRSPRFVLGLLKDLVHAPSLNTDKSCGYHVHMGIQGATLPTLRRWAIATEALAKEIEAVAFKAVPDARQLNSYCRQIEYTTAGTRFDACKYNNNRRYHWLNTVEIFRPSGIRTVEVRLLGNTHRWKYVLAWSTFCMLLGREGWKIAHRPFESRHASIKMLTEVLEAIIADVKPLNKRHEAVPAWVYSQLKSLGIEWSAFDRPLIALHNAEAVLAGKAKKFYSDNQDTEPESNSNDDECECGCGENGRCYSQMHNDGDCDSSECSYCCEDGQCGGSPDCCNCRDSQHCEREWCGRDTCSICERNHVGPQFAVPEEAEAAEPVTASPSNIVIHRSNSIELRRGLEGVLTGRVTSDNGPLTLEGMQTAVNDVNMAMNNAMMYGTSIAEMIWVDESARANTGIDNLANYAPSVTELFSQGVTLPISEEEQIQSRDRETFYHNGGDR